MGIPNVEIPKADDLKNRYSALRNTALKSESFNSWLAHWNEVEKLVCEARNVLQFRRYANTSDEFTASQQSHFAETIEPLVAEETAVLRQKYFAFADRPLNQFAELERGFQADDLLYSPKIAELESRIAVAANRFSEIKAQIVVPTESENLSVGQAYVKMTVSNRFEQEKIWRAIKHAEAQTAPELDALYLELVNLRKTVATSAGFDNYRDFRWIQLRRSSYTPETCHTFTQALTDQLPPFLEQVRSFRRERIGVADLRPWDGLSPVFPKNHDTRPISIEETVQLTRQILSSLDESLAIEYDALRDAKRFDLEPRAGKASIMIAEYFPVTETSCISMMLNGHFADTKMFFHEVGHAIHYQIARENSLIWQQPHSVEFMEFFAHFMELYALKMISTQFKDSISEDLREIKFIYLDGILNQLAFCVTLDRLQHFVYAENKDALTPSLIKTKYLEIAEPLGIGFNFDGLLEERALNRHFQHLYSHPFYFIEYGFAWIQALRMLNLLEKNPQQINDLLRSLKLGGSLGTKELFEVAGIPFEFDENTVRDALKSISVLFSDLISFTPTSDS